MTVAVDAKAEAPAPTPVGAIPRNYNFAADILDRNLKAGRADKPAFIDPRGTWTYGQLADRDEHVDLQRPDHRPPAGQPVPGSPVVQPPVGLGEGHGGRGGWRRRRVGGPAHR